MIPTTKPKLDGFEFLEYLGGGAFGQVWKTRDVKMNVLRAIKVLPKERIRESEASRLLEEAQAMAQLPKHRNRVAVHYFKDGVTNCFLVMDYVSGGALRRHTSPGRPLPWRAARYAAGVADALLDVHARGLLHRDIKPDNIFLDLEADEAVLGDFGIAISVDQANRSGGTRGYIAPELYHGAASFRSDIFSLSATLLHLATGERPGETIQPARHANWASLPEELRQVILAGLNPDPDRRPDPATFVSLLREARWKAVTDQMLAAVPNTPCPVKLQASVAVASAEQPETFRPLPRDGRSRPVTTGNFIKVEAQASADGYLTVLVLGSSGEVEVGLPCPTEPENLFRAGQPCTLIFQLTPPAGTERLLICWTGKDVRRTPSQWREWLERAGLAPEEVEPEPPARVVRGAEFIRARKGPAPEGQRLLLLIPVPHVGPTGRGPE